MCAGIAGDISLGTMDSCTLRSKIWDDAGVEDVCEGTGENGRRAGDAATWRLGGEGEDARGWFMVAAVGDDDDDCVALTVCVSGCLSLFFPRPNSRRLLALTEVFVGVGVGEVG